MTTLDWLLLTGSLVAALIVSLGTVAVLLWQGVSSMVAQLAAEEEAMRAAPLRFPNRPPNGPLRDRVGDRAPANADRDARSLYAQYHG